MVCVLLSCRLPVLLNLAAAVTPGGYVVCHSQTNPMFCELRTSAAESICFASYHEKGLTCAAKKTKAPDASKGYLTRLWNLIETLNKPGDEG